MHNRHIGLHPYTIKHLYALFLSFLTSYPFCFHDPSHSCLYGAVTHTCAHTHTHTHTHTHIPIHNTHARTHTHAHTHAQCTHSCTHTQTHTCTHTHTHAHAHTYTHNTHSTHTHTPTHTHAHTHTHTHTHTHLHTHMHIPMHNAHTLIHTQHTTHTARTHTHTQHTQVNTYTLACSFVTPYPFSLSLSLMHVLQASRFSAELNTYAGLIISINVSPSPPALAPNPSNCQIDSTPTLASHQTLYLPQGDKDDVLVITRHTHRKS